MSGRCGISPAGQPRLTEEARIGLGLPLTLWFGDCSPADARLHQRHRGLDDAPLRMTMTRSLRWRTRPRSCEMKMFMLRCAFRSASRFSTCAWIRASSAETRFITDDHGGPCSDRAGDRNALALTAREFKLLGVVGESGSGKSTMARMALALDGGPSALKRARRPIGNQIQDRAVPSSSVPFAKAHRNQFTGPL